MAVEANIEHVHDMKKIMEYSVMRTPALVINEKVIVSGRVPTKAEVTTWVANALA